MKAENYTREDIEKLVAGPDLRAKQFAQVYKKKQANPGLSWGIPEIDKVVLPMRPGDMVSIIARPGHAKTAMLAWKTRQEANRILSEGIENAGVIVCSWETTNEEYVAYMLSDEIATVDRIARATVPYGDMVRRATENARLPIYFIGRSQFNAGFKTPRMTLDVVENAIELLYEQYNVRPTLLVMDYLQIIPVPGVTNKTEQVETTTPWVKQMAMTIMAPVLIAAQAGRQVDSYDIKIPHSDDCQHSSAIEQASDKLFGQWRPSITEEPGSDPIEVYPGKFVDPANKNLLIFKMLKQRDSDGVFTWALDFDMRSRSMGIFR